MTSRATPILLVEDTPSLARVYAEFLKKESDGVVTVETGAAALEQLADGVPRIVLLDLQLPDMHGMEVLKRITAQALPCAVIIITAHGSVGVAVEAMRYGAYDFLVKPFSADRLTITVRNAIERLRLAQIVETFGKDLARSRYHGFIGSSLSMQAVYRIIDSAASSRATVFITGESGTGKEVCAEAIHRQSPRAERPFVAINCGAIPKDLMESEIFGHMKGSFTGALADREGAAARADGGTLFLDEICELAPDLQTKLLRFIQTGTFTPVGGSKLEKVDLRIICATNRDPLREVEEGRFREDLYYRLHVIPIHLPALREREDDVLEIARHFLADYAREEGKGFNRFSAEAEQALRAYHWPGNVRQVQNVVRNIVVLHDGDTVTPAMLPAPLGAPPANGHGAAHAHAHSPPAHSPPAQPPLAQPPSPKAIKPLWEVERDAIEEAVAACDGNIPRAAALLEISASTIYRKRLAWQAEGKI
ncbi:sigma-54-dependent transcriptional regulator [Azospirillum rugosum]|uniref:DNA-binding NtrC family response regulator n=1 Tax=Azospirillum rugosum TaxID=416170 RepID=A0ABS4SPZ3_9PROT|nr:sigma-54 dependent transcriptional regulator [Azospirillum rugosum]MBP2294022.1 DNA-binding NtrC family response regulator [Azospirillum rugosum]MDQ0526791.1 DNA-binding NtrC family response regulator [Azospirillum rugosum]